MKITIYGASDDLVEVDGCEGADEFNEDDWFGDLIAPDGSRMRVYVRYELSGCWSAGVGQGDEDEQLPGWPVTITQAPAMNPANPGYSALLTVDAPEGTRLVNGKPAPDA
jgi:hypothetical protein